MSAADLIDLILLHHWLRSSFHPPLAGFPRRNQVRHFPESIRHASGHRGRHAQRAVNLDKVVREAAKRNRRAMVLDFLTEGIRQAGESPHRHPDREIVVLHVGADGGNSKEPTTRRFGAS